MTGRDAGRDDAAIVQLQVRLREDLRRGLKEAAKARGTSLNAEIVRRLGHANDRIGLLAECMELAYGPRRAGVLMLLGLAMAKTDDWCPGWDDDRNVYADVLEAVLVTLVALRPEGMPREREKRLAVGIEDLRDMVLGGILRAVRGDKDAVDLDYRSPPAASWADAGTIRSLLGSLVERISEQRISEARRIIGFRWVSKWLRGRRPGRPFAVRVSPDTAVGTPVKVPVAEGARGMTPMLSIKREDKTGRIMVAKAGRNPFKVVRRKGPK